MTGMNSLFELLNELLAHMDSYSPEDQLRLAASLAEFGYLAATCAGLQHIMNHIDPEIVAAAYEAAQKCAQEQKGHNVSMH